MRRARWVATAVLVLTLPAGVAVGEPTQPTQHAGSDRSAGSVVGSAGPVAGAVGDAGRDAQPTVDRALVRAVQASRDIPSRGRVTVVSFGERGPQITELDLARGEGSIEMVGDGGYRVGRVGGTAFLRSSEQLLRVGGAERVLTQLDRLQTKYDAALGETAELDTGPALPVRLTEHATGQLREVLYLDDHTGLVVRRETYDRAGAPVRVVAYTSMEVGAGVIAMPAGDGLEVEDHEVTAGHVATLRAAGFVVPDRLPHGYELVAALEVPGARVPTLHLVYGDGLYSVSLFQQQGTMRRTSVDGAVALDAAGGTLWRWPGSEPRRIVWGGGGLTFTLLADAPTDELIEVAAGLPIDPEPSTLDRLGRGLQRLGDWFTRDDRSET